MSVPSAASPCAPRTDEAAEKAAGGSGTSPPEKDEGFQDFTEGTQPTDVSAVVQAPVANGPGADSGAPAPSAPVVITPNGPSPEKQPVSEAPAPAAPVSEAPHPAGAGSGPLVPPSYVTRRGPPGRSAAGKSPARSGRSGRSGNSPNRAEGAAKSRPAARRRTHDDGPAGGSCHVQPRPYDPCTTPTPTRASGRAFCLFHWRGWRHHGFDSGTTRRPRHGCPFNAQSLGV